jgi:nucleoside permease NupC
MNVEGTNPKTGEEVQIDAEKVDGTFLKTMSILDMTDAQIRKIIDNLNVSADTKSLLYAFSQATLRAGQYILKIGRKIIDFVCKLVTEFPSATFGMVFGAIAGFLITSIPLLGAVLGPLFAPIAIAFGIVGGVREDMKDRALARRVAEINAQFTPLNT